MSTTFQLFHSIGIFTSIFTVACWVNNWSVRRNAPKEQGEEEEEERGDDDNAKEACRVFGDTLI